jgi:hypothetical protein
MSRIPRPSLKSTPKRKSDSLGKMCKELAGLATYWGVLVRFGTDFT